MNNNHENQKVNYSLQQFLPLIILISLISAFTGLKQIIYGWNIHNAMYDFMGSFFVIFSLFKIINLNGFVKAYSMYDVIAKHSIWYAYAYPFIELSLGIGYLLRFKLQLLNSITLIIMIISSIGVAIELAKGKTIVCACLGAVFKIPMTYVTLAEDITMGIMALLMLLY